MVTFAENNRKNMPFCVERSWKAGMYPILYSIWIQPEFGDIADEQPFVIAIPSYPIKAMEFASCMEKGFEFELNAKFFESYGLTGTINGTLDNDSIEFIKKYDNINNLVKYEGKKKGELYRGSCTIDGSYVADFVLADSVEKLKKSGNI